MKTILISFSLLICMVILSCDKEDESDGSPISDSFLSYDGNSYDLSKSFFMEYGTAQNGCYDFEIVMYSKNMQISDPDDVVGSDAFVFFNIYSPKSDIQSGLYVNLLKP